jgi:hypothetical protein
VSVSERRPLKKGDKVWMSGVVSAGEDADNWVEVSFNTNYGPEFVLIRLADLQGRSGKRRIALEES